MEFIKPGINIDFVGKMKWCVIFSLVLTALCIVTFIWKGFSLGIDFAGGTLIQIKFFEPVPADDLRKALVEVGVKDAIIQPFGKDEVVVRTAESSSELKGLSERLQEALSAKYAKKKVFEIQRVEVVGPKVGRDLTRKAILAVLFSWVGMLVYVAIRFEFRYAVGGIVGVIHDVIVVLGIFTLLGKEFTLSIVAALLTVIGYSIHDSIVVFDRIRENVRKEGRKDLATVMNASINQTLSRTILTSFTTALVCAVLYAFGGAVIRDFAFVLLAGVVFGTYSSVFVAGSVVLAFEKYRTSKRRR
ncbi:MAG TPA: protein translocase subunit SecF [Syntrophales bacterium]|nr:protein translocase subunit SecF [Syntrophales bacterium]HOL59955.1 protein translocase subunit SecF [Syntrophales bacterium]HPO35255.1 protein translocase subunit SecF [Syntrophales bacterium]